MRPTTARSPRELPPSDGGEPPMTWAGPSWRSPPVLFHIRQVRSSRSTVVLISGFCDLTSFQTMAYEMRNSNHHPGACGPCCLTRLGDCPKLTSWTYNKRVATQREMRRHPRGSGLERLSWHSRIHIRHEGSKAFPVWHDG